MSGRNNVIHRVLAVASVSEGMSEMENDVTGEFTCENLFSRAAS